MTYSSDWNPGQRARKFDGHDSLLDREITMTLSAVWAAESRPQLEKVLRNARDWARVNHPYVATLYDLQSRDQTLLFVTERHRGPSLQDFLCGPREGRRFGVADLRFLVETLGSALHYAHGHDVVHGELCLEQILLCPGRRIQLLRYAPEVLDIWSCLGALDTIPTLAFFQSPQQTVGLPATPADDIWALGVLLHRVVMGSYPFDARSLPMLIDQVLNRAPAIREIPSGYPAHLGAVIARCLSKEPGARFSTVEEMVQCLYPHASMPTTNSARVRDMDNSAMPLIGQRRYEEALTIWQQAVVLGPGNGRLINNVGVALCRLGRLEEAEAAFRKAADKLIWDGHIRYHWGWVLWKLDRLEEAQTALRQAIKLQPKLFAPYFLLALTKPEQESVDLLLHATLLKPRSRRVHLALADTYSVMGRREESLKHREYAQQLSPDEEEIRPRHMPVGEVESFSSHDVDWLDPPDDGAAGILAATKPPPRSPEAGEAKELPKNE